MKLQIKTTKLQEMLSKAVKGASNNKLIPLTSLVAIQLKDNELTITTTDATNYLYVKDNLEGEDFYAVLQVDMVYKLVSKLTCETTVLEVTDNYVTVKGNGTYKLDMPLDEDGTIVKYPNPADNFDKSNPIGKVKLSTIKAIMTSLKQALLTTNDYPWYTCYYAGDMVIATDTFKISALKEKLFTEPKLISAEQMNLIDLMTDDEILVYADNNKMLFETTTTVLFGVEPTDIEEYAVDAITSLIDSSFTHSCKLSRDAVIRLLERISLFVGSYDNGEIGLTFTSDGLEVTSKQSNGTEIVPYISSENPIDFECAVNVDMLLSQVKAQNGDSIELWFGEDNAIKLVNGNITAIVALLTE